MFGIISAIYSSFFLGLGEASLKKSYKEFEPSVAFFLDSLLGLVIWIPVALYFGVNLNHFWEVLGFAALSAILSEALYFYALSKGQLSVTTILIGSYPIYTIIFSYFINGERLTQQQFIFIAMVIAGTLFSYLPSKFTFAELKKTGAIFWPVIAAIGIGLSDTLSKGVIDRTADFTFLFALALVQIPVALVYLRIEKQSPVKSLIGAFKESEKYKHAIIGSLFAVIGTGLLWVSFSQTLASIASPITATSGVIVVLLAIIFMDEKITVKNVVAMLLVFIGIMGISLVSGG